MKIIKNNVNLQDMIEEEKVKSKFPMKVSCDWCESEIELDEKDLKVSIYGLYKFKCPCCGEETVLDDGIDLTIDNLEYPKHYSNCDNAVDIDNERINKWVKECIEKFDDNDKNDWVRYTGSGNVMVFVFKMDGDEAYEIYVCKNYEETFLPFNVH